MSVVLDDIKYFLTVCETRNVTRASEIVGVSQPALSYAIKRLERELGADLLVRLKNGIELTKLGEEFRKRATKLIHEWEFAQNLAQSDVGLSQATYTIAAHPSVALHTFHHFLPRLQNQFPRLNFKFIHGLSREMTEKVVSWEADFGIVVNPVKHPDLVIKRLYTDEVAIFSASKASHRIIYDRSLIQAQFILKKLSKSHSYEGEIHSSSIELIAKLCSAGIGHAILPTTIASPFKNIKKVSSSPTYNDEICLIYRADKQINDISVHIIESIKTSVSF